LGTINIPAKKANKAIQEAPIKKGRRYLKKEIPELKIAMTSVLFANFDVNQMTERKRKIGNNKLAKYQVKSM
jgi:hypothetical protein